MPWQHRRAGNRLAQRKQGNRKSALGNICTDFLCKMKRGEGGGGGCCRRGLRSAVAQGSKRKHARGPSFIFLFCFWNSVCSPFFLICVFPFLVNNFPSSAAPMSTHHLFPHVLSFFCTAFHRAMASCTLSGSPPLSWKEAV